MVTRLQISGTMRGCLQRQGTTTEHAQRFYPSPDKIVAFSPAYTLLPKIEHTVIKETFPFTNQKMYHLVSSYPRKASESLMLKSRACWGTSGPTGTARLINTI